MASGAGCRGAVPDVLLGGGGDAEAVVVGLSGLPPEGDGFLDAVSEPAWSSLSDEEAVVCRGVPGFGAGTVWCGESHADVTVGGIGVSPDDVGKVPLDDEADVAIPLQQFWVDVADGVGVPPHQTAHHLITRATDKNGQD